MKRFMISAVGLLAVCLWMSSDAWARGGRGGGGGRGGLGGGGGIRGGGGVFEAAVECTWVAAVAFAAQAVAAIVAAVELAARRRCRDQPVCLPR